MNEKLGYDIQAHKWKKYIQQKFKCAICGREIMNYEVESMHLAHRVINSKINIRKYGDEIINHEDNMLLTCPEPCNRLAIIRPYSLLEQQHINCIRKKIYK